MAGVKQQLPKVNSSKTLTKTYGGRRVLPPLQGAAVGSPKGVPAKSPRKPGEAPGPRVDSETSQESAQVANDSANHPPERFGITVCRVCLKECQHEDEFTKCTVIPMSQLALTKPAPNFSGPAVVDGEFKDIKLEDYRGKYLVFFFYPLDFTFVCPTELIAFSDRVDEFRKIDCEVVACSCDSHFSHLAWVNTPRRQGGLGEMKIPLLADKNCEIAKAYGVYKQEDGLAFRGLFIIDANSNLRQITINDLPVGRSVDETLRLVQAFQFTDKHGEVCPAGWKPGQKTMKPDQKGKAQYFEKSAPS